MARDGGQQESVAGRGNAPLRSRPTAAIASGCLLLFVLAALVGPLAVAFVPRGAPSGQLIATPPVWPLFLNSVYVSVGVGVLATAIGLLGAWRSRGAGAFGRTLILLPLALPSYLSYAGWSVFRAPGTWLGDWIGSLPGARAGEVGHAMNASFAMLGMVLWLWPLAAIVIGAHIRRLEADLFQLIRAESGGIAGRAVVLIRLLRPSILLSIVLIALVTLGTAIPLHVANVPTLAISVWLALDRLPADQSWRALLVAWPLWVVAGSAGWWLGGRATTWAMGERALQATREGMLGSGRGPLTLFWLVGLSVLVPTGALVLSTRNPHSIVRFWRLSGEAVIHGMGVAALTAAVIFGVSIATCLALGERRAPARIGKVFVRVMLVLGLSPGVLLGTGLVGGWNRLDPSRTVTSGVLIEVLAHVARFGWIGAVTGCAMLRLEHPHLRDLRRAGGAETLLGFARTGLLLNLPVVAAASLGAGLLSFTEIECAVVVQPPGPGNLARQILNYLHFARMEEMSAAAVWIVGSGILLATVIGWLLMVRDRAERTSGGLS